MDERVGGGRGSRGDGREGKVEQEVREEENKGFDLRDYVSDQVWPLLVKREYQEVRWVGIERNGSARKLKA